MSRFFVLVAALALLAGTPVAMAQSSLTEAQEMGLVGERPDGLVGIVATGPSAALQALVDDINRQRLDRYRAIAAETSSPLAAVQARAGAQITARVPSGGYVMDTNGVWQRK